MAKATIKSKSGATITIEGTDAEVSQILATYDSATAPVVGHPAKTTGTVKQAGQRAPSRDSAGDLIVALKEAGFFDKPKTLGEVGTALEEQGYLYPVTTLSGVVLRLVKRAHLRRKKVEGRWVYGK